MAAKNKSNEIQLIRLYDAPVKQVWDAWTDVEQVAKWWGPRGFTITTHSKDLRPGGHWAYTMHGPDGIDYPNRTHYYEVEKYSRLVYDHGASEDRPPLFRVTVTFTEQNGRTKLHMIMSLATPEAAEETKKLIKKANGNSTWDRLAEYLAKETKGKVQFVINRTFDAPIALVFEMWTDPKHAAKWVPPTGFTMEYIAADIRSGGSAFYSMSNGENVTMYGKANYIEVQHPDRIVYTQQFCDEKGNVSRHPFMPTWPETKLTTITLAEEAPDRTRVTITWEPQNATPEELNTFIKAKSGMMQGWTGSLDKLEEYLLTRE